jgi:ankyrin repeat protein
MSVTTLPQLPAPPAELVTYLEKHRDKPMTELLEPYRKFEAQLRQVYAQEPDHAVLRDPHVNVLPLFTKDTPSIKIRARNLEAETEEERNRYIMSLPAEVRRPNGSPATVQSLKEFQRNFNVFSESSLVEMDWSNVVAAGSSVVGCLLPVPKEFDASKRTLREFYHEKFAPASDVDLFLYGLTEEEAVEKIRDIETHVRDSLLTETTTVRTKHAVTICSQHPIRHIQIVLRIYKSVSEIVTGFDIDCSGAAYDGKQVYCSPRALQSYMTQINHIDLSRRSPSYENRLSKYSHRGFEVYWNDLERDRIDPTIFERSFNRTLGLARLLVLERLPTASDRDKYLDKRREERGRPPVNRYGRQIHSLYGNIKEQHEDEVADWVNEEEVSNYHTFSVPYGPKFHAKKIEKLCYTRDLLLNAEWNQPEDREVYLHRHPAFFGRFEDVMNDCCGYCPKPVTDEEKEIAEKESKIYVSGKISFIKDDPGRQQIGSFNPLTDDDWTEMAYVGNTARLCQAIVDCDVEHVQDWLAQEGADPNTRDYTGRTPLHLAVMSSTPEIVRRLVDAGARLVARIADGRTALHFAAQRGDVEIVKILMDKSLENEVAEEERTDQRRKARASAGEKDGEPATVKDEDSDTKDSDEESVELVGEEESDDGGHSMVTGSFIKVDNVDKPETSVDLVPEEDEDDPDFYDVNVIAWDTPCSALHFAIVNGHEQVVKLLCEEYGADVLLPVKFLDSRREPLNALLTLVLALALPAEKAKSMAKTLLSLGATSAQADLTGITAFHRYVQEKAESLLETLWDLDKTGSKAAVNHIAFTNNRADTPLQTAAKNGNLSLVLKLLDNGALAEIDFETWLKSAKQTISTQLRTFAENENLFKSTTEQPLIMALKSADPSIALKLIERGANVNTLTALSYDYLYRCQQGWWSNSRGDSALDIVQAQLKKLRKYKVEADLGLKAKLAENMEEYLKNLKPGSYQHWMVSKDIEQKRKAFCRAKREYDRGKSLSASVLGVKEKEEAVLEAIGTLEAIEKLFLEKGAKTFESLYPEEHKKYVDYQSQYNGEPVKHTDDDGNYTYTFSFSNVIDVTPARQAAYLDL